MNKEQLKELGYYIIRVSDNDRYLWEVYADNDLLFIEGTEERAISRLNKITEFIQK